jgi:hypothetical protein
LREFHPCFLTFYTLPFVFTKKKNQRKKRRTTCEKEKALLKLTGFRVKESGTTA